MILDDLPAAGGPWHRCGRGPQLFHAGRNSYDHGCDKRMWNASRRRWGRMATAEVRTCVPKSSFGEAVILSGGGAVVVGGGGGVGGGVCC